MGFIRLYLALCIVTGHAVGNLPFVLDGTQSVQIFFIISGFYMALILDGKYTSLKQFYVSRSLRIFVPYYLAVLFVIAVSLLSGVLFHHYLALQPFSGATRNNGLAGIVLASVSNITLLFQDVILFLSQPAGQSLRITTNFITDAAPLWHYQLLPQCWSVSLELMFYLVVPFLARFSSFSLMAVAFLSLSMRFFAYEILKLQGDQWGYRFFPFEITLFILGMLGYRFYRSYLKQRPWKGLHRHLTTIYTLLAAVALIGIHSFASRQVGNIVGYAYGVLISYSIWPFGLGLLFYLGKADHLDKKVGELSYPIYLLHFILNMFLWVLFNQFLNRFCRPTAEWPMGFALICAIFSVCVAAMMYCFLLQRFETWRHQLMRQESTS